MNKTRIILFLLLLTVLTPAKAQELEYKMELGGALGGSFYLGDLNSTPFRKIGLAGRSRGSIYTKPQNGHKRKSGHRTYQRR